MGLSGQRCEALNLKSQISSRHRLAHRRVFHHRGQLGPWVIFSCKVSIQMGLVPLSLQGTSCLKNKVQLGKWRGGARGEMLICPWQSSAEAPANTQL